VLSPWKIPAQAHIQNVSVYSSIRLQNGNYILGTISNGIINLNSRGDLLFSVDKTYGLSNNTVLSVFEDRAGNIWLGLDNGINCINLRSPFRLYRDIQGTLGTVYATARTDAYMYLGTNQGLFYKSWDKDATFKLMPGTMGQVWVLRNINGTLFCGHDKGTFLIKDDEAIQISSEKGTWELKQLPDRPNVILQGNYKGLSLLGQNRDGGWIFLRKLNGFEMSSRYFEFVAPHEILVSHEYKGVFRLQLDKELTHIESFLKLPIEKGISSSVFKYRDTVYYAYKKGVYKFNKAQNSFTRDTVLSQFINPKTYVSGKFISDTASNRLWAFNKNQIIYLKPAIVSGIQELNTVPIPDELRDSKLGYETILALNESSFMVGTTQGYIVIDLKQLDQKDYSLHLDRIVNYARSEDIKPVELFEKGSFSAEHNNFEMEFSISDFNALYSKSFQYRLRGLEDNWSEWSRTSKLIFENLPHGDYVLEVRGRVGETLTSNSISYRFSVNKPWYLSSYAIVGYIAIAIIMGLTIHLLNRRYYRKQKDQLLVEKERELELEQLENQRQLMAVKNENLQLDIDNKSRELGMATMNLVKKNELLHDIKVELIKSKSAEQVKQVIKMINVNMNDTSDWKRFEEAFNNVDKEFMKRIKELHPTITPNDLRLCTYLRLNLSSKEIAPLLNISHKSVEVKRYRLRKKMGLAHNVSLSNYIIEL
jgi:AraC family chitin signaling transcriptional activator